MNDNLYYICNDIYVDDESYVTNDEISHYLRSNDIQGDPETTRAALHKTKLWPKDSILNVVFIGGEKWQHTWVEKVVKEQLEPYTNIKFSFDPNGKRTIRISFNPKEGAYSAVGTDALMRSINQPTMNLGWLDAPGTSSQPGKFTWKGKTYTVPAGQPRNKNENGATVMHEFGHALGFIHEHQNPRGEGIKWDTNKVYSYFSGPPNKWNQDTTFRNVLKKYNENQINGSQFDPESIMLYFFDGKLTTDGKGTHMNTKLSDLDKQWLRQAYAGTPGNITGTPGVMTSPNVTPKMAPNVSATTSTPAIPHDEKYGSTLMATPNIMPARQDYVEYAPAAAIPAPKKDCKKRTKSVNRSKTRTPKKLQPKIIIQTPPPPQQTLPPLPQQQTCMPLPVAANFLNSLMAQQGVPQIPQIPGMPQVPQIPPTIPGVPQLPPQVFLPPNVPCPPGYNRDAMGICTLQPCPPGQYRDVNGNCVEQPCPPGYNRDATTGTCIPTTLCPPGQYKNATGVCVPTPCPPGYIRNAAGACVPRCPPGYGRNAAGNCVKICPPGYIRNSLGQCTQKCPPGYVRNAAGGCTRAGCPPGYTRNVRGQCVKNCAPGYTRNAQGLCVKNCAPGYARNAAGVCIRAGCPAGFTRNAKGQCVKNCAPGYTRNASGLCVKNCAPGYTRNSRGLCVRTGFRSDTDVIEHFDNDTTGSSKPIGLKRFINNKVLFLFAIIIIVGIVWYMMRTPEEY